MLSVRLAAGTTRGLLASIVVVALVLSAPGVSFSPAAAEPEAPSEVRALWVLRSSLASRDSIALALPTDVANFRAGAEQICARPDAPDAPAVLALYRGWG